MALETHPVDSRAGIAISRRRVLSTGLGLVGSAALLAACGPGAPATPTSAPAPAAAPTLAQATPVTVDMWHIFSGRSAEALSAIASEFTAQRPAIAINAVYVPYDAMLQNLLSAIAAGSPPTLAGIELTLTARLAAENGLAPIEQLMTRTAATALKESLIPTIREANSYNGVLYTVPMGYNSNQLYFNPELVRKAGLDPERDLPRTWDALIEASTRLTSGKSGPQQADVWGYGFPSRAAHILEVRFWQAGAELFDASGKQALFNSDRGQAMFDNYARLQSTGGALLVATDSGLNQLADLFGAGKVALFEQSSTAYPGIAQKAQFQLGVGAFPSMGKAVYSMGGYNLGVFRQAPDDKRQAAVEFMQWWSSAEPAARWTAASNYMPGVASAWDTPTLKAWRAEDPRRAVAAEQLPAARPRPNLPQYPQIAEMLMDAFEATLSGQEPARTALDRAAARAQELLSR
jgi:sn-glycerol 3-phosphate transport system substrate-binding protein